jgi:hypothetical protein
MTAWHLDDDALRRYVERTDSLAEGASAEQHLLSCEPCRARVNAAAGVTGLSVIDFAAVWDRTRDAVEVPRPSVFERLLRGAGLPAQEARLVAVASAFRGVWLAGVAAVSRRPSGTPAGCGCSCPWRRSCPAWWSRPATTRGWTRRSNRNSSRPIRCSG